jgi:hypothetical protein
MAYPGMTRERDAGLKFLTYEIVSSLSMTPDILKFPHTISERNHKLRRISIQKEGQRFLTRISIFSHPWLIF